MSRKRKKQLPGIEQYLDAYADGRGLDFHQYSPYHMRLMDGALTVIDIWTSGHYWIMTTDYLAMVGKGIERGGEKGELPMADLEKWLDRLFFPEGES